MLKILGIAYIIPACAVMGYFLGKFLNSKLEGSFLMPAVLISLLVGFIMSFFKIKQFVDEQNQKSTSSSQPQPTEKSDQ